ncbi:hypothetical protein SADUNF_Sadunf06G0001500 [Salix dunnii]|uniref:Uncharacterized protein n=1 Tax=Salix dunnii TaxID=1413687 RepID=A0A835MWD7_9ROSI|nr:hypothetical protein SADUNF_Sadunf06G0001500 [Salix dunnii]
MAMTRSKTAFVAFLILAAYCILLSAAAGIPAGTALSCETAADCKKYPIKCAAPAVKPSLSESNASWECRHPEEDLGREDTIQRINHNENNPTPPGMSAHRSFLAMPLPWRALVCADRYHYPNRIFGAIGIMQIRTDGV